MFSVAGRLGARQFDRGCKVKGRLMDTSSINTLLIASIFVSLLKLDSLSLLEDSACAILASVKVALLFDYYLNNHHHELQDFVLADPALFCHSLLGVPSIRPPSFCPPSLYVLFSTHSSSMLL